MRKKMQTSKPSGELMGRSKVGVSPAALYGLPGGCKNEQGMALVMALVMIALLGMLGAFALSTSTTEMRVVGNYRTAQSAYYAADLAVEYLKTQGDLMLPIEGRLAPGAGNCAENPDYNSIDPDLVGGQKVCYNAVSHPTLQASAGSGSAAEMTSATNKHDGPEYATINVIGYGRNNTEYAVETQVNWGFK